MTLQNRVLPTGEIVAEPWTGTMMGNRGILHRPDQTLGPARWRHANWVCCLTEFRGRHRDPMPPGRYTALFFWDEASAFAAGHRPCGECRNRDYRAFKAAWEAAGLDGRTATEIDRTLHRARVGHGRRQRRHSARFGDLPAGTFFRWDGAPGACVLRSSDGCWAWAPGGYRPAALPAAGEVVEVLTPRPVVEVFRAGYRPAENRTGAGLRA